MSEQARMIETSARIASDSETFFSYTTPVDFRIEERHPQLFPTNVRPETLAQDAELRRKAAEGSSKRLPSCASPLLSPLPSPKMIR